MSDIKLIINIPKWLYDSISEYPSRGLAVSQLESAISHGIPIPDNATNGDVIKAMFPDAEIHLDGNDVFFHHMGFWIKCNIRWWNAPYQKGGK